MHGLTLNKCKDLDVVEIEGKGLGVVAGENIRKGEFVLEYKYNLSYPRKDRAAWEEEYQLNGEGSYVLDVQLPTGKWLCLDATRNFGSFGRLVNHSVSRTSNLKLHTPLLVNRKWRVGMYAKSDINRGEELSYDYGDQPNKPDFMRVRKVKLSKHRTS
jgi:histone-lysine N-methyltransferase SETD2